MIDREGERRHNPNRTFIPRHFVDLGKLFDEDSSQELLNTHEASPDSSFAWRPTEGTDNATHTNGIGANGIIGDDFMIGANELTDASNDPTAQ